MRVERYQQVKRPRRLPPLACGCLGGGALLAVIIIAGALFIVPNLPNIAMMLTGFQSRGTTETLFQDQQSEQPAAPLQDASTASQVVISAGPLGSRSFSGQSDTYSVTVGTTSGGSTAVQARFDEQGLLALCSQYSDICGSSNPQIRDATFDLKPGGGVIYADALIPEVNVWQPIGVAITVSDTNRIVIEGVDVNGTLYDVPPGALGDQMQQAESAINQAVQQLSMQVNGGQFNLSDIQISEDQLTLILD